MKKKKQVKVPQSLKENSCLVLPMVVEKEYNLSELMENLKHFGFKYTAEILMKYLTSYHFRKRLERYLKITDNNTDPEYYIELYIFP